MLDGFGRFMLWDARRRLRALDRVVVDGLEHLSDAAVAGPVIAAANHVCWWDAPIVLDLSARVGVLPQFIADVDSVRRYPFFRRLGAIPVDRSSALAARRGLRDAAERLSGPGKVLWVFPQGKYCPTEPPFDIEGGFAWLAKRTAAVVVPVTLCYPFLQSQMPAAYVAVGAPIAADVGDLEAAWGQLLAASRARAERDRFAVIPEPGWAARWLGRWVR